MSPLAICKRGYETALSKLLSYHVAATQQIAPGECERDFSIQWTSPMTARELMLMRQAVRDYGWTIVDRHTNQIAIEAGTDRTGARTTTAIKEGNVRLQKPG